MATAYLVSTALMGLLVVGVLLWLGRVRGWYQYSPAASGEGWSPGVPPKSTVDRLTGSTSAWLVAFALLVVGFLVGVVAFISAPAGSGGLAGPAVAVGGGLLLVGYLLFGVYISAKRRGHPSALAAAESATVAGTLFLVAITVRLVLP
ncbi:hypothetical protein ACFQJ5_06755 [Halomicroarcula sp. GCM10025324]|uniref:hypothetical protein n=1 Tax=Haloarcula TaxID=2237 RepID=UPI0023E82C59|nr:hypothetical protein [Halomicroarcula sp. ZS-22-S1]